MSQTISPLRYPGGKAKLFQFVKKIILSNNINDGYYVEAYAGGASIALQLLQEDIISEVVINDLDRSIYAFWYSILNYPEEFCQRLLRTRVTINQWMLQREVQKQKATVDLFDLGFSTFFLNRTNRSGIINAGVIGGIEQAGEWKIDARFNKEELINRIMKISKWKDRIHLFNTDACIFINNIGYHLPDNSLCYFDPPYFVQGKNLYVNYYNRDDHKQVADVIRALPKNWIVTYDSVVDIKNLYFDKRQFDYTLNYTAGKATKGTEVMIYSDELFMPELDSILNTICIVQ